MNIVLEGPDNAGKSVLGRRLAEDIRWTYERSRGAEPYPGEILERIRSYFSLYCRVFDRHPCISQNIYRGLSKGTEVPDHLIEEFYTQKPIIVYCRPRNPEHGILGHVADNHNDTSEYLVALGKVYPQIVEAYDKWALQHAHFIYRIGDDEQRIITAIRAQIRS